MPSGGYFIELAILNIIEKDCSEVVSKSEPGHSLPIDPFQFVETLKLFTLADMVAFASNSTNNMYFLRPQLIFEESQLTSMSGREKLM